VGSHPGSNLEKAKSLGITLLDEVHFRNLLDEAGFSEVASIGSFKN
jgi:hypothetical protein